MSQRDDNDEPGPVGSDEPIPHHVMPAEKWEAMQAKNSQQQK